MQEVKNQTFDCISPVDQSVYCTRTYATHAEIESVMQLARQAQPLWAKTSWAERARICERMVVYFEDNQDAIAKEISWQMGRPWMQARSEVAGLAERARHMIAIAQQSCADDIIEQSERCYRAVRREPLGCVWVLAPWNYPYLTAVNTIIPALMAGNVVVLKHSSQTPLCAERFAQALAHAQAPEGVFSSLAMSHKQVMDAVSDPRVDFVAFTGSVKGGRALSQAMSHRFIGLGLELGGKDPAYVCADADVLETAAQLVDGTFYNSGQSCCGIERIYVDQSCFDDFIDAFTSHVKQYRLGDPLHEATTLGPMVNACAAQTVQAQINQAKAGGAQQLIATTSFHAHGEGAYLAPQVLIDVDHSMSIMTEETFGPAIGIMAVKDQHHALALMNDSCYGLTASIWTKDRERAEQLGLTLQAGTVFMNRCDYLDPALAWSGLKDSGRGCSLSSLGYQQLTRAKSYCFNY